MASARDALALSRRDAIDLAQRVGVGRTRRLLEASARELELRMKKVGPASATFTYERMKATLAQLRLVTKQLQGSMTQVLLRGADDASDAAAEHVVEYLERAHRQFGVGRAPLQIKEAAMLDSAREGARASMLSRIASSGEPIEGADEEPHPAKQGVLERYGAATIEVFHDELQKGLLQGKTVAEVREAITEQSPFLQAQPASWSERIVRTEMMGAYGKASWEATREADEQLGDVVKIISSVFDERTGADSIAVHGQIRRPDEAFETWFGYVQHPPDRPNDRGLVVPHRIAWPIPAYLAWRSTGEVLARWRKEGRKGAPPPRPKMTTVPLSKFGR